MDRLAQARRHAADVTAFLDEDFLAVAGRPAIVQAILVAAMATGAAQGLGRQWAG